MQLKKLLNKSFWSIDWNGYHKSWDYDKQFNASFRGVQTLSSKQMCMPEIKYVKMYRFTQACANTIWYRWAFRRLQKYGRRIGVCLHDNMHIPQGLIIGHAGTIIINGEATFGGNIFMTHGVTIGRDIRGKRAGAPHFGKNVVIRCNSTVVGKIEIGEDVLIAPNTFVNFDVPAHSVVIGNPATIHHRDNATEGHIGVVKSK